MKSGLNHLLSCLLILLSGMCLKAEDGHRLWLRYEIVSDPALLQRYRTTCRELVSYGDSETLRAAKKELMLGVNGLLQRDLKQEGKLTGDGSILMGTPAHSSVIASLGLSSRLKELGDEGFLILSTNINRKKCTVITANRDVGVLYGVFHFLKLIQTHQEISALAITSRPGIERRVLNHWDNLDGSIERGYAGTSIWDWQDLPEKINQRYIDYARANASIGINGAVLNNVNANPLILTPKYLEKVAAIAKVLRPYGIKVYLSAVFSAPVKIGGLKTADPIDQQVAAWWKDKVKEIYQKIPDFGGFCVKANSEGQPGPQDYGRTHADGANMLADALAGHGGVVMWRAFVYSNKTSADRTMQAYDEFLPFDGKFRDNVLLQVKNGPVDFQPREPFHPLFGAMPQTQLMLELQITQEYLGFSTHLVYLGSLFEESIRSDTYSEGRGSTIAKIITEKAKDSTPSGIAGVANIGSDTNWCGHPFAQANWYAFGRLAWNPGLDAGLIADEWLRMTFSSDEGFLVPVKQMMMASRETAVDYMTPLGLTMLMDESHYRPAPWRKDKRRADGTSESFHQADSGGIGFNRTKSGSNAVGQYFPEVRNNLESLDTCPENLLLWFHHVPWDYRVKSGRTVWEELCKRYYGGVDSVRAMVRTWNKMEAHVDKERFHEVKLLLAEQEKEAVIWRDACVLYFQTFSRMPVPDGLEKPSHSLEYYKNLKYKYEQ